MTSCSASESSSAALGYRISSIPTTCRSWSRVVSGSGYANMVRTMVATIDPELFGTLVNRLAR